MFLEMLHCWQLAAHSLCNAEPRDCPDQKFEGHEAGGGVGPGIVHKLHHGQEQGLVVLLEITVDPEVLFQPLVHAF